MQRQKQKTAGEVFGDFFFWGGETMRNHTTEKPMKNVKLAFYMF